MLQLIELTHWSFPNGIRRAEDAGLCVHFLFTSFELLFDSVGQLLSGRRLVASCRPFSDFPYVANGKLQRRTARLRKEINGVTFGGYKMITKLAANVLTHEV